MMYHLFFNINFKETLMRPLKPDLIFLSYKFVHF